MDERILARQAEKIELVELAEMAAERFSGDPQVRRMFDGIHQSERNMAEIFYTQLQHSYRHGKVYTLDDCSGLLAVHHSAEESLWGYLWMGLSMNRRLKHTMSREEQRRFSQNNKGMANVARLNWRKKAAPRGYYFIDLIAVEEKNKGTGAFRRLMHPVLTRGDREMTPVLVDTYNPNNLPIYEHFGFVRVEEHPSKVEGPCQYCMMRDPR